MYRTTFNQGEMVLIHKWLLEKAINDQIARAAEATVVMHLGNKNTNHPENIGEVYTPQLKRK
jgi:hypothetical protein